MKKWWSISLVCLLLLAGCGGSSSSPSVATTVGNDSGPPSVVTTLSGVAAAGAPIAGIVNVKGANGETASSPIGTDGQFSLDVSALTAPYILFAEGMANGQSVRLFSSAVETGKINITPITDFILRSALADTPETALSDWTNTSSNIDQATLADATQKVKTQLQPLLTAVGVADSFDPMSSSFAADGTGFDQALDDLSISYDTTGTTATVTNKVTTSTFTDDVTTTVDDSNALPPSDQSATQTAQTDEEAIAAIFQQLANLYATNTPTNQQITDFFYTYAPADFLDGGLNRDQEIADWAGDDGPPVGTQLSTALVNSISVPGYDKAFLVRLSYTYAGGAGNFLTEVVYDGSSWLWYGDRHWLQYNLKPEMDMVVDSTGSQTLNTGFDCWFEDTFNYAYDKGIRSVVVTGPGFPANGLILASNYPNTEFSFYNAGNYHGSSYWITDDAAISSISDNATYTIQLCTEDASVALATNCSGGEVWTETLAKRPLLNSELNTSLFPVLTSTSSHNIADFNIGGVLNVTWTNPGNVKIDHADLGWWDGNTWNQVESRVQGGGTTVSFDSSTYPSTAVDGSIWMSGDDLYRRQFSLEWQFQ